MRALQQHFYLNSQSLSKDLKTDRNATPGLIKWSDENWNAHCFSWKEIIPAEMLRCLAMAC